MLFVFRCFFFLKTGLWGSRYVEKRERERGRETDRQTKTV